MSRGGIMVELIKEILSVKSIRQLTSNFTLKSYQKRYLSAAGSLNRPAAFHIQPELAADVITN